MENIYSPLNIVRRFSGQKLNISCQMQNRPERRGMTDMILGLGPSQKWESVRPPAIEYTSQYWGPYAGIEDYGFEINVGRISGNGKRCRSWRAC